MNIAVRLLRWIGAVVALVVALAGLAAIAVTVLTYSLVSELPSIPDPLTLIIETPPTEIFAANGERVLQIGGQDYVPLHQVSRPFIQAILATEDHRFWEHHGVNKLRTFKALWITLFSKGRVQGASTITQQLAKNLFFSFEQTWSRKIRELLVAVQIESQFSKQEILEAYVNQIYFGPRARGIESAARYFFNKSAGQLNLAEASLLAGLPKSPTRYNPLSYPENAKERQKIVLNRMVVTGDISVEQAGEALSQKLAFSQRRSLRNKGDYFIDWIIKSLEDRYGSQVVYHGGLKVITTMDPHLQDLAEQAVDDGLRDLGKIMGQDDQDQDDGLRQPLQGALVAVQVNSGAVKAMVGGRGYAQTEYNRAVESNRLPGSGFKPFVFYSAFQQLGLTPASVIIDKPIHVSIAGAPDWRPQNFKQEYFGDVILKKAFAESLNSVAAQLIVQTGPESVIDIARRCGVGSPLAPVYSLALGTSGVSPLEMASSFATFAGGGVHYPPFGIWRVEDAFGQVLEEHIVSGKKVLDAQLAFQLVDMMQGVVDFGTGKNSRRLGFDKPAGGKTGTTNDYMDAWFTGFTPALSTSVWVGYDQPAPLKDSYGIGITGGRGAVPIWTQFMIKATDGEPARPFLHPVGIHMQTFDPKTGQPVPKFFPNAMSAAMRVSTNALDGEESP